MNPLTIDRLADTLSLQAGFNQILRRDEIDARPLTGVERLHVEDYDVGDTTVIFRYSAPPLTSEASVLQWLQIHRVPVPWMRASDLRDGLLGMLLDDPEEPVSSPTIADAARAAAAIHRTPHHAGLTIYDVERLAELPARCQRNLAHLRAAGRWPSDHEVDKQLAILAQDSATRAAGATMAPWGMCHGELRPSSLHVFSGGWRLLDCAQAFIGPGLLDLASWQGTTNPSDIDALDALIDAYLDAGGDEGARWSRGGRPATRWALGWHRLRVADWYLEQAITTGIEDEVNADVIARHLSEAAACLA